MSRPTNILVDRYQVQLFADPSAPCRATITAFGRATQPETVLVVIAHFVAERQKMATPCWADDTVAHVYYPDAEFDRVLDLLRNERPVRFFAHEDPREWRFGSGSEAVGEGE